MTSDSETEVGEGNREKSLNKLIGCLFLHVKKLCQAVEIKLGIKIDIISPLVAQSIENVN